METIKELYKNITAVLYSDYSASSDIDSFYSGYEGRCYDGRDSGISIFCKWNGNVNRESGI